MKIFRNTWACFEAYILLILIGTIFLKYGYEIFDKIAEKMVSFSKIEKKGQNIRVSV